MKWGRGGSPLTSFVLETPLRVFSTTHPHFRGYRLGEAMCLAHPK